jgi:hypothetical protein
MHQAEGSPHRYPGRIGLRLPLGVREALEIAARHELTSPTEYARRAITKALRADGVTIDGGTGKVEVRA